MISQLEDKTFEISQLEEQKKKEWRKTEPETCGTHQAYQHVHFKNLTKIERKRKKKYLKK